MFLPFNTRLHHATFLRRPNRFIVEARLDTGEEVVAHLPDPGRLKELLLPEASIWLRHVDNPSRKTQWSIVCSQAPEGDVLVSLDTTLPNQLVTKALQQQEFLPLCQWAYVRQEFTYGGSRWDVLLREGEKQLLLEIKSVTLSEAGVAYFPDAVTARGTKHVKELTAIQQSGDYETAILLLAQREDVTEIRPAYHIDPHFSAALQEAEKCGVRLLGHTSKVTLEGIELGKPVKVDTSERKETSD